MRFHIVVKRNDDFTVICEIDATLLGCFVQLLPESFFQTVVRV